MLLASPIELEAPDLSAYREGNTGIAYVTQFDSGQPGPHVMICALTHGNEICGAIALDQLFRLGVRPVRGRLTFAFNNIAAFDRFDCERPTLSRYIDEDFNRLWDAATLVGPRNSRELSRARELRPLIDTVDLLLDIHSMQEPSAPLMLAGMLDKSVALARSMGMPEIIMRDKGHAAGARLRDYGPFGDPASEKCALLIECGQHWQRNSAEIAIAAALRFLTATGILSTEDDFAGAECNTTPQRLLDVTDAITVSSEGFRFVQVFRGLELIPKAGTVIAYEGERPIVTPYDECVMIMPSRALLPGQTAVRLGRYVARFSR